MSFKMSAGQYTVFDVAVHFLLRKLKHKLNYELSWTRKIKKNLPKRLCNIVLMMNNSK